ncbi:hypothetical protein L873DRAFT_1789001 [Choiromyces venosus 120613-1]|uniref:Uncharacterized protein n=1 Tax=Choiromyces venosus 120613-1 TaxID=1336337 RepID=A0A3N4K3C7_9PEZI|nr:hypothetical protein L873DRAFT_1789001 [Choiromyces venosus 120613-1]
MSLYLNWNGKKEDPFTDMEDNWSDTARPNPFEIQASLIPNRNKFQYESARGLVKIIEDIVDSGSAGVPFGFLYFRGLVDSEFDIIEEQLQLVQLRSAVRFTFENSLNAAILRIMPGPEHEKVGFCLVLEIVIKIASIPGHSHQSTVGVGATRFKVPGVRSKEGDHGLHPDTRLGRDAWPSLMIEVGYSEGLNLLHLDARWWLINSQSKTRFVIIVKISRNPFAIHLECWRMAPTIGRQTRQTPAWSPTCVQEFHIDSDGVVVSPTTSLELRIPYDCIFDRPSPNAQPIMFSFAELSNFALRIFRMLE